MAALLAVQCIATSPSNVGAQTEATVRVAENFRGDPNGVVLARLQPDTELQVLSREGNWTEVEVEAWVWLRSLQVSDNPSYDLVVSLTEGENLRSGPSGTILGRLEDGVLLTEMERAPAWARVSRTGWIWSASLIDLDGVPVGLSSSTASEPAARLARDFASVGAAGGAILNAPDGDTLALASAQSDIEVVGREGNWARVRLDGWMWMPSGQDGDVAEEPTVLEPTDLRTDPEAHAGRVVAWTLQFISLERAEAVRTDFFEGEPFLLTRFGGGDGVFVYVAVPSQRLAEVEGLVPLEQISITGRVRTSASSLTGTPIVDLLVLDRSRSVRRPPVG